MSAIGFRVGIWLRRRLGTLVLTATVVGLVSGVALGVVAGTRRTASAPDRYTRIAGGDPDFYVTQTVGAPLLDEIDALPKVERSEGFAFVLAFPLAPDGTPLTDLNPFAGNDNAIGTRVVEGRFTNPDAPDEMTVNTSLMAMLEREYGTKVGDRFTVAAYSFSQLRSDLDLTKGEPEVTPFPVRLVGVTESPSDFDESSDQLIYSKGFLRDHADVGVVQTLIAVHLKAGATTQAVMDEVRQLPNGEDSYAVPVRIVSDGARRAVRFQTVALWLVSALAVIAAVAIVGLVIGRTLRVSDDERTSVQALGWTRRHLAVERAVEGAIVGLIAVPLAALLSFVGTSFFPLGVLRKFEPDGGPRADWLVMLLGALAVTLVGAAIGAIVGHRSRLARVAKPAAVPLRGNSVPVTVGVHFATVDRRGHRTWAIALVGAIGIAGIVGAAVAGSSLTSIVDDHDRWGADFDQLYGNPYAPAERDIVTPIVDLPHVAAVTGATVGSVTIDGQDTATFAFAPAKGDLHPTVIEGRSPSGDREIGLGAEVTRRLGVDLGDTVEVAGTAGESRQLKVVGLVVTPDSAGNGAALPFDSYAALNPGASQNVALVDYEPDAPASAKDAVSAAVYSPPDSMSTPTTIKALERVTTAPYLLCIVFAGMLLVGGAFLLGASVRARRRDYGSLRAMGSVRGQRRAVVHWQASAIAAVMTLVGVPIGIVAGQRVVAAIVSSLGIVPGAEVPWWLLTAGVAGPLLVANLLALVPARQAARTSVTTSMAL